MGRCRIVLGTGLALGACVLAACATNPVTGRPELVLMSSARERELGNRAAEQVARQMGLVQDAALVDYVARLGQRLARESPRQDVRYSFRVVDLPEPNAFALPGGQVYVSRGLLALIEDEAELGNVLGHEIAHVAARHAAQRQTRGVGLGIVLLPATVAGAALGAAIGVPGHWLGSAVNAPLRLLGGGLIAAYGRDQEREADRVGQGMAARAGIDPAALSRFMARLEAYEKLQSGKARRPSFFDSHPTTPERIASTREQAESLAWSGEPSERAAFLNRIEGLLLGPNPAEGVFEGSRFLHPDLDLTVVFPEGWTLVNERAGVGAFSPQEDAQVVLEIDGEGSDPKAAAGRALEEIDAELSVRLVEIEDLEIGPHAAVRAQLRVTPRRGVTPLPVEVTWVAKAGLIFRFTATAKRGVYESQRHRLRAVAEGFRSLSREERRGIQETRLRVVSARAGESLADLGARSGNVWSEAETAVANGLGPGEPLVAGQRLKVAVREPY